MLTRRWFWAAVMSGLPLVLGSVGCLKRTERIQVSADGSVKVRLEYEGEPGDFNTLDALLSDKSGWHMERGVKQENGKEIITLHGERTFAPREDLPSAFSLPTDSNAGLTLQFPTTLVRERRADGIYLHFRRVYKPREWSYVDYWSRMIVDDNIKKLGEKKPEELTHDERMQLIRALAGVEAMKQIEFAVRALREADPSIKQDHLLSARKAVLEVYEERINWDELAKNLETMSGEDRDAEVERIANRVMDQARSAFVTSLRSSAKYDEERIAKFDAAFDRAKRYYDITNQQAAHAFEIRLSMPGEMVAHNGDKIDDGEAVWEFDGNAFRDRSYELMVTSKLPLSREDRE